MSLLSLLVVFLLLLLLLMMLFLYLPIIISNFKRIILKWNYKKKIKIKIKNEKSIIDAPLSLLRKKERKTLMTPLTRRIN